MGRDIFLLSFDDCGTKPEPGQFVNIRLDEAGILFRRPFSVFSHENGAVSIMYRVIGKGTEALSERKQGTELDVLMPLGNAFSMDYYDKPLIIAAGGIGLAGVNMLRLKYTDSVMLFGDREGEYREILEKTGIECDYVSENTGRKMLVTGLLKHYKEGTVIACGPKPMLKAVYETVKDTGMQYYAVFEEIMACGLGLCAGCTVRKRDGGFYKVCKDGPVLNGREIEYD